MPFAPRKKILDLLPLQITQFITARRHTSTSAPRNQAAKCICRYGLVNLDAIQSSNFEVVQMTPAFPGYDDVTAPTGAPPTINSFTASAGSVAPGTAVTLKWSTTNDSYDFIDVLGGISGGTVTTTPT